MYCFEKKYIDSLHKIRFTEESLMRSFNNLIITLFSISLSSGLVASVFTLLLLHNFNDNLLTTGEIFAIVYLLD
jgi:hypothetical protein